MKNASEIKIGIFVISGFFLLVLGWAFLREFAIEKQTQFNISFSDVAGLTKGSFTRINGLRVGRVDSLTLDIKKNKVIASVRIQIPDIKIPNDSKFLIRTSGYVGDKFLDIALGMSDVYIMDGQEVVGEETVDAFKSLEKVSKVLDQINPELLAMDIQDTATNTASLTKKADKAVDGLPDAKQLASLIDNARFTVTKLESSIDKAEALANDSNAQNNISMILSQANQVSKDLNETIKNANVLANNKQAYENVNALLIRASKVIEQLDEVKSDPLVQNELRNTLNNTNTAAKGVSVASEELSSVLNQRFLLPKLLFGKVLPNHKIDKKKKNDRSYEKVEVKNDTINNW